MSNMQNGVITKNEVTMIRLALPEDSKLDPKYGNRPHCGITACAIVSGKSHRHVKNIVQICGKCWKGGMHTGTFYTTLNELGIQYEVKRQSNNALETSRSIKRFVDEFSSKQPTKTFLVLTGSHAQVVQGRKVADQGGVFDVSDYRGKRYRTSVIFEIITPVQNLDTQLLGLPLFDLIN
mgnify:FL=1